MKIIKVAFMLFAVIAFCNSCADITKVVQRISVNMKNNSGKSVHMWISIEEDVNSNNLLTTGEIRQKVLSFEFEGDRENQNPMEFVVCAGENSQSYVIIQISVDYWKANDGKTIDYNIQYNSDGSFTRW